ncbi:hypothetical protein FSW04_15610 [Baekduia soli]|uniref:Uncharacterized protein n=1 Tax=Baekduia soli TaxID=496014 RepID=A0A5B8U7S6_9ACTN|nr:hypothetical protein [Baekduia soli]QEC48858.1 hypothetical protein FSW04_15610 [Baekduia soli]
MALDATPTPRGVLPETAAVHWRPRADARRLRHRGRLWTLTTAAHVVPFVAAGVTLFVVQPLAVAVSLAALAHAWIIPGLYAARGANVLRPRPRAGGDAERTALGLLGDLVDHAARDRHAVTGLVVERGRLGVWVVGEAGAVLVSAHGRRVHCFCVRVADPTLPSADRIAHLLLALRADEQGFATVANLAFSGARWRLRRRLPAAMRPALDAAGALDRVEGSRPRGSDRRSMVAARRVRQHDAHDHRLRIGPLEDRPRG